MAGIYLARAGVIWLFITLPPTPTVVLLFAAFNVYPQPEG